MLFVKIILLFSAIVLIIRTFVRYDPKFDLIKSGYSYKLLLWYNWYNWWGDKQRTYLKIFEI